MWGEWLLWDEKLFVLINQKYAHDLLDPLMKVLSSSKTFIPFYLWGVYRLIRRYRLKSWIPIIVLLCAFGLADGISSKIFKPYFQRLRPAFEQELNPRLPNGKPGGKYGFVSSHSANAFAVYPLLVLMVFYQKGSSILQNRRQKWALMVTLWIAFWIAYSRVYLGVHYFGDVFFGGILGVLICCGLWTIYTRKLHEKYLIDHI